MYVARTRTTGWEFRIRVFFKIRGEITLSKSNIEENKRRALHISLILRNP